MKFQDPKTPEPKSGASTPRTVYNLGMFVVLDLKPLGILRHKPEGSRLESDRIIMLEVLYVEAIEGKTVIKDTALRGGPAGDFLVKLSSHELNAAVRQAFLNHLEMWERLVKDHDRAILAEEIEDDLVDLKSED